MSGRLDGARALVIGGSTGIGAAIAAAFRAEGASVVVGAFGEDDPTAPVPCIDIDVRDEVSVEGCVRRAREHLGGIDVLVNSAGVSTERYWRDLDAAQLARTLDVNLVGTFRACRAVLPEMIEQGSGRIINIASQLAIKGGAGLAHYAASKAGVIALTKSLALEVSEAGVLVNCIAPGPINTAMTDALSSEWRAAKSRELPLGRFGRPEEIAPTAVLLASTPDGDLYVGQTLGPNSGDVMP